MRRDILDGCWYDVKTFGQHEAIKEYGNRWDYTGYKTMSRVQIGNWQGEGRYLLLTYQQRCPRNCCYDNVHELISTKEVREEIKDQMKQLASVLKEIKEKNE